MSNSEVHEAADRAEIIRLLREQNEMFKRMETAIMEIYGEMNVLVSKFLPQQ